MNIRTYREETIAKINSINLSKYLKSMKTNY